MTSFRFVVEPYAWLRPISWKTFAAFIAGAILASTMAYGEVPVAVPKATEALLAQQQAANIRWAAFQLIALAIPLFFLFTGFSARLRRMCESISGRRWFLTVTLFVCAYLLLAAVIALPFDYFAGYIQPHDSGWGHQTLPNVLKEDGAQLVVGLVLASLFIWLPYRLIARSPRHWWLYSTLALLPVAFLALVAWPVWVDPLTTTYKPLDDRPLEARIDALAARCGITHIPVLVGGNSTRVTGLGPTNRIVLQNNLASVETPDQIVFTIGHELKHYVMGDNWKGLAIIAVCLLVGFWLTDRLGRAALRRFSGRWGFSEPIASVLN
jgi:STE24 endopeptidase